MTDEGLNNIRMAIVRQAVLDWRMAERYRRRGKTDGKDWELQPMNPNDALDDAERFLMSQWCYELTGMDNDYILNRLRKEKCV